MADRQDPALSFAPHDHARCRHDALAQAEAVCAERGLRLTPVRRRVLEILLESHRALGAYDVLGRLTAEGAAPQPPVAYRALEFLTANGLAHRIERLNAYVACVCPGPVEDGHVPAFLICRGCDRVAAVSRDALAPGLLSEAATLGFAIETPMVEISGLCPRCREAEA